MQTAAAFLSPEPPHVPQDGLRHGGPLRLLWNGLCAQFRARREPVDVLIEREFPKDRALLSVVLRAATAPGTTSTSGWASELVSTVTAEWVTSAIPSAFSALAGRAGLRLDFGQGALPSIPARSATPAASGAFVLEGNAIPTKQLALSASTLFPKKLAVVVSFTNELAQASRQNVEQIVREEVVTDTAIVLDNTLLDATAATTTRPPGLRSFGAGLTPTAGGGATAMVGDVALLLAAISPAVRPVLIVNGKQSLALAAYYRDAIETITSPNVPVNTIIALDAASFVVASGTPSFRIGKDAILHMVDTAPADIASGAGPTAAAVGNIAAPTKSMFQTDTLALQMVWELNWALRRGAAGVAWIASTTW